MNSKISSEHGSQGLTHIRDRVAHCGERERGRLVEWLNGGLREDCCL